MCLLVPLLPIGVQRWRQRCGSVRNGQDVQTREAEILEFLRRLLSPEFMPHGYCYLWDPWIVWLNVISDSLITLAYFCIPLALVYLVRQRRDLPFNWIFWMFALFILGCGTTHLMEVWTVWHGSLRLLPR